MSQIDTIVAGLARLHSVPPAHVHAVIDTESGGQAFTTVKDRFGNPVRFPLCRFEGHHFYKYLSGEKLKRAIAAGLAAKKPLAVKNPKSQQGRYDMLMRACEIDREAAFASCSWGVGQVLGSHWKKFGMASAESIYDQAASGLDGQIDLMFDFIDAYGIMDELREGRWSGFAEVYNGPKYRTNRYDEKLASAAKRHGGTVAAPDGMLRLGAKGPRVKELQRLLGRAGFAVKADGSFGATTRSTLIRFQKAAHVEADGVAGPETFSMLERYYSGEREDLQKRSFLEIPKLGTVVTAAGGGATLLNAKEQVESAAASVGEFAGNVASIPSLSTYAEQAASGLVAVAGVLGVVAVVYAGWQWVKAGKTYEGVPA